MRFPFTLNLLYNFSSAASAENTIVFTPPERIAWLFFSSSIDALVLILRFKNFPLVYSSICVISLQAKGSPLDANVINSTLFSAWSIIFLNKSNVIRPIWPFFLLVKVLSVSKQNTHLKLQIEDGSICKQGGYSSIILVCGKISYLYLCTTYFSKSLSSKLFISAITFSDKLNADFLLLFKPLFKSLIALSNIFL